MAPTKWITAVLAGCLSGSVLAAPTATSDNQIVKRASINDVSDSLVDIAWLCIFWTIPLTYEN
jgi:pectate lyase